MDQYKVFVRTDDAGRVLAINSDAFLPDAEGWTLIDEGEGDRYHHAQGNYLPLPLTDEQGVPRYKVVNGVVTERSDAEMDAEHEAIASEALPTTEQRLAALEEQNAMLTECLLEMSELVYV